MEFVQKAELPPTELGQNRCFQIEYFGHGDIYIATWDGPLDFEPTTNDGESTSFGFAHGSDVLILASLAGYLKRLRRSTEEIRDILHDAGKDILNDDLECIYFRHRLDDAHIGRIANGGACARFDVPDRGLACLVMPVPSQPGIIEQTGGTGIYTRNNNDSEANLVFAGHKPVVDESGKPTTEIVRTADFCSQDIPVIAQLVCNLALGEYRRDLQSLLISL